MSRSWISYHIESAKGEEDMLLHGLFQDFVIPNITKIEKWFFIRYNNPQRHIRLRVLPALCGFNWENELSNFFNVLNVNTTSNIKFIQQDYKREVFRYGGIEFLTISEDIFCSSAECVVSLLKKESSLLHAQRIALGIIFFTTYLKVFCSTETQRLSVLLSYFKSWTLKVTKYQKAEEVKLIAELSKYYEDNKLRFSGLIGTQRNFSDKSFEKVLINFENRLAESNVMINRLVNSYKRSVLFDSKCLKGKLAESYIHMHMNRLGLSNLDEVCVSFILLNYYSTNGG